MPTAGSRLAGEREYAFKHVLIRDVAYSTLPKAVRARKHAEVGDLHRGARRRSLRGRHRDGRRPLRPRRRRSAPDADLEPEELERDPRSGRVAALEAAGDASAALYSNQEALGHYETALALEASRLDPDGRGADRREARRRRAAARPGRPRGPRLGAMPRVPPRARRTWPGSATCTARSAPGSGTRATARARSSTTSAGSTCSRTARRASSWCGSTRRPPRSTCTPATTCSRSTPRRRRCASPSASARRPRRAARTGSSAASSAGSATPSARARTSSARSSWRATPTRPRRSGRCSRSAITSRSPRPTTRARATPTARRWRSRSGPATCRHRSSCTPRSRQLARPPRRVGDGSAGPRPSQTLAEREGLTGKLCFPYLMRGVLLAGARATSTAPVDLLRRAAELGRAGRPLGGRLPVAALARARAARARRSRRRRPGAGAGARPLRARRPGRPVGRGDRRARGQPGALGQARTRRARRPTKPPASPSACATRSARPPSLEARGAAAGDADAARPRRAPPGRRSAARSTPSAASASANRSGARATTYEPSYASPSSSYSRRKPSNRRWWPCSSWRIAITMSWVTGSIPSVSSMIRL